MTTKYANILIHIGPRNDTGGYPVDAELDDESRFRGGELRLDMERLREEILDAEGYGMDLFYALFNGPIRRAYDKAAGRAESETEGHLRVRLWIDEGAAELHAVPWERIYHTHRGHDVALATSTLTPFSRYTSLEIAETQPLSQRPIRMLFAISNPTNLPGQLMPALIEQEVENLRQALGDFVVTGHVQVTLLPGHSGLPPALQASLEQEGYQIGSGATTLNRILRALPGHQIFHFLGHGHFNRRGDQGQGAAALYMEKEGGEFQIVTDEELVGKLTAANPQIQLVFLAACESAKTEAIAEHPFVGLGPRLVAAGVPAVVAMQDVVPMDLARQLTEDFYRQVMDHGIIDRALNQARLLLFEAKEVDWAIPVLFMRQSDGRLFDFSGTEPQTPPLPYEPETILVPAGSFLMGSEPGEGIEAAETPYHELTLPAFRIARYPITNEQYAAFILHAEGHDPHRKAGWELRQPPADRLDHPVVGISWHDAMAYCRWLSEQSGRTYRLPSEAEWEKASRGADGRTHPWGMKWRESACNHNSQGTTPVGAYPEGASPYGCQDMLGNVQEWTSTLWGGTLSESDFPYPYQDRDGREDPEPRQYTSRIYRVHRGGSYQDAPAELRCSARGCAIDNSVALERGFRVLLELPVKGE